MSRNEDYLDNLLTSVTDKLNEFDDDFEQNRESLKESYQTKNDLPSKTQRALDEIREDNFLKEFENELREDGIEDDFMREFERELSGEADRAYDSPQMDEYVNQMGQIVDDFGESEGNPVPDLEVDTMPQADLELEKIISGDAAEDFGAPAMELEAPAVESETPAMEPEVPAVEPDVAPQAEIKEEEVVHAPKGMESLEDIFGSLSAEDTANLFGDMDASETFDAPAREPDDDLKQILGESDQGALSEIDSMLHADDGGQIMEVPLGEDDPFSLGADFSMQESTIEKKEAELAAARKKKERDPNSFLGKMSRLLFGTAEELDPETTAKIAEAAAEAEEKGLDPKSLKQKKKEEQELKKQQKKAAAEEKKKEKELAKAEKAAQKAAKPKKEKKPKEKKKLPKETPLPKVPVMMMWIIALSIMAVIFLGTSLINYTSSVAASREAFGKGDYVTAYTKLQGVKIKPVDEELYESSVALAAVQTELNAYTALMERKKYEMALDALIRGLGRCELNAAKAEEWNVSEQLQAMDKQLITLLKEQFDVSRRKAKKLYKIQKRSEYTLQLQEILKGLGLN